MGEAAREREGRRAAVDQSDFGEKREGERERERREKRNRVEREREEIERACQIIEPYMETVKYEAI